MHRKFGFLRLLPRRRIGHSFNPHQTEAAGSMAPGDVASVQEALRREIKELDLEERRAMSFRARKATCRLPRMSNVRSERLRVDRQHAAGVERPRPHLQPYLGTNVTFDMIREALTEFTGRLPRRGYVSVSVALPAANAHPMHREDAGFRGRVSEIQVVNNHYFSSNNIMRALASLRTKLLLINPISRRVDRANANQDRQIYPRIETGRGTKDHLLAPKRQRSVAASCKT